MSLPVWYVGGGAVALCPPSDASSWPQLSLIWAAATGHDSSCLSALALKIWIPTLHSLIVFSVWGSKKLTHAICTSYAPSCSQGVAASHCSQHFPLCRVTGTVSACHQPLTKGGKNRFVGLNSARLLLRIAFVCLRNGFNQSQRILTPSEEQKSVADLCMSSAVCLCH